MFNDNTGEELAHELDERDKLKSLRSQFFIPQTAEGRQKIYFSGNSLGLQPKSTPDTMQRELVRWQQLGSEAHWSGDLPWYSFQDPLREKLTRIVGANSNEIILMNGLTVNIHLMLISFYQPTKTRYKILMCDPAFPSDQYAVKSFLQMKGYDPQQAVINWQPKPGQYTLDMEDLQQILADHGEEIALIWIEGVNYLSGQAMDMQKITELGHQYGCVVGYDLAHAAGNIFLQLHDWNVDFAAWCSYKYLNAGPGAVAGCFVHEKHVTQSMTQLAGWYGNDPATRFKFDPEFVPFPGASRWQLSNPAIFSMLPLHDSLNLFEQAGMNALRDKSVRLSQYLRHLLESLEDPGIRIITPRETYHSGCQLSVTVRHPQQMLDQLRAAHIVCDLRHPNIIRMSPVPLYNNFSDIWKAVEVVKHVKLAA